MDPRGAKAMTAKVITEKSALTSSNSVPLASGPGQLSVQVVRRASRALLPGDTPIPSEQIGHCHKH